jgi:outer membrane protein assembly factor BamA
VLEKNLVPAYKDRGYLKFTVAEISPRIEGKDSVRVEVAVSEGDQFKLAGYNWSGNTLIPGDELSKKITLKTGEPVNALQLERDLTDARKLFGKFGRVEATIMPVPAFDGTLVTYNFQVNEGELYHMGKLEIEGIEAAQVSKLTQAWKLAEGAPYDSTYVQQFLAHTVVKVASRHWEWKTIEQVDVTKKTVDVRLQLKFE